MLNLNAAVCPFCRSTWPPGTIVCGYCFDLSGSDPDQPRRRRRYREHLGLTELFMLLAGSVRRPDEGAAFWPLIEALAQNGPVTVQPSKKRKSQSK